jgi:hypothetical protein
MNASRDQFILRRARLADLDALLTIKQRLSVDTGASATTSGGFILGVERDAYQRMIAGGCVELLEVDARVVGFAVALPDPALRASDVWRRRAQIQWVDGVDPAAIESTTIGYFDQLAVLPGIHLRAYGAALGLRALTRLLFGSSPGDPGHEHVLTTTLRAPVRNTAALAYLQRIGARPVGSISERYPQLGTVTSDIYLLRKDALMTRVADMRSSPRVARLIARALEPFSLP